jgi:hypothetical protein
MELRQFGTAMTAANQDRHKARVEQHLARGPLGPVPYGPVVDDFNATELANVLEHTANKAADEGMTKVRMDMSLANAQQLASYLRRAVLAGAGMR